MTAGGGDDVAPIPARPMLPGFFRVIPMGPDMLQLRSAGRVLRVGGPGVGDFGPRLLGALEGGCSLADLVDRMELEPGPATDLIAHLYSQGVVSDGADADGKEFGWPAGRAGGPTDEVVSELGRSPVAVRVATTAARVAVVGLGPVGRLAARQLAAAGIGELVLADAAAVTPGDQWAVPGVPSDLGRPRSEVTAEECVAVRPGRRPRPAVRSTTDPVGSIATDVDLVVVEVDEVGAAASLANRACMAAGVVSLFHSVTALDAVVGPCVTPGTPGCHECLVERRLSHIRHYDEHVAYQQWLGEGGIAPEPGLLAGFASLVAGLVSMEALRSVGRFQNPVSTGGVLVADLRTSQVRREALLPVPACPACDALQPEAVLGS